jgi:hypothetical protein
MIIDKEEYNRIKNEKPNKDFLKECKKSSKLFKKNNKVEELYEWLKGERYGYFLEDHKTWINYGTLEDKFPYDENDKQRELSRNHMIYKTIRKMKELNLIDKDSEE